MQLDECPPFGINKQQAKDSLELSYRWGVRSKKQFGTRDKQNLFGIVQGSIFPDLRRRSAEKLVEAGFDGYAIGGLAVGEGFERMVATLADTVPHLPEERPRYLMGVGKPRDIIAAVRQGVDMFDCVIPTRSGRHGQAWTFAGPINLKNARFADDGEPLAPELDCPASCEYSKAYLHHLFKAGEILGQVLLSWHNLAFFQALMQQIRADIRAGCL